MQKLTLPGDILLLPCNKNKRKIEDNIKDIKILIRHLKNDSHKKFKSITIVDKKKIKKKEKNNKFVPTPETENWQSKSHIIIGYFRKVDG